MGSRPSAGVPPLVRHEGGRVTRAEKTGGVCVCASQEGAASRGGPRRLRIVRSHVPVRGAGRRVGASLCADVHGRPSGTDSDLDDTRRAGVLRRSRLAAHLVDRRVDASSSLFPRLRDERATRRTCSCTCAATHAQRLACLHYAHAKTRERWTPDERTPSAGHDAVAVAVLCPRDRTEFVQRHCVQYRGLCAARPPSWARRPRGSSTTATRRCRRPRGAHRGSALRDLGSGL